MIFLLKNETYGNMLDKTWFAYGNIKPDIDFNMKTQDHTIQGANIHIKNELEKIEKTHLSREAFSESLGIINHFICDSFCAYHNRDNLIKKSMIQHFLYESKIHYKLKAKKDFAKYKSLFRKKSPHPVTYSSILTYLKEYHIKYLNKKIKPKRDLKYAILTCILINNYLLKTRQEEINFDEKSSHLYLTDRKWA